MGIAQHKQHTFMTSEMASSSVSSSSSNLRRKTLTINSGIASIEDSEISHEDIEHREQHSAAEPVEMHNCEDSRDLAICSRSSLHRAPSYIKKYDSTATKYRKCDPLELFEAYKKNWGKMKFLGRQNIWTCDGGSGIWSF